MPVQNPTQLVEEFKKSGEFDRLRRELLAEFRKSDGMTSLMNRVEDIGRQKLTSDQKLQYMPDTTVFKELMQELDRYPIVERAVADVRMLSDPDFAAGIRKSVTRILQEDRGETTKTETLPTTSSLTSTQAPSRTQLSAQQADVAPPPTIVVAKVVDEAPRQASREPEVRPSSESPEDEKTRAVRFSKEVKPDDQSLGHQDNAGNGGPAMITDGAT